MFRKDKIAAFFFLSFFAYSTSGIAGWFSDDYKFTPPATAEGKTCIEKCEEKQDGCKTDTENKAEKEHQECNSKAEAEYNACLRYSCNRATCSKGFCIKQFVSTSSCSEKYRTCYQNCGGTVDIIK